MLQEAEPPGGSELGATSTSHKLMPGTHPVGCPPIVTGGQIALSDREQVSRKLRVSIVRHCNFRCFFCHNEGQGSLAPSKPSLGIEELARLCGASILAGIREIKLTGGEPLLYRHDGDDIVELVRAIAERRSGHAVGLSMTTNGLLLDRYASALREAGLDRVTISLHTLKESTLRESIHQRGSEVTIARVLRGLDAAVGAGLEPVKVNTVVFGPADGQAGNLDELPELVRTCRSKGVTELRLYSLLSHAGLSGSEFTGRYRFWQGATLGAVADALADTPARSGEIAETIRHFLKTWTSTLYPKPTLRLDVGGLIVCIEAMADGRFDESDLSAEGAYALRLSSDGTLRGSLESEHTVSLLQMLRDDADDRELRATFAKARRELLPPDDTEGSCPALGADTPSFA